MLAVIDCIRFDFMTPFVIGCFAFMMWWNCFWHHPFAASKLGRLVLSSAKALTAKSASRRMIQNFCVPGRCICCAVVGREMIQNLGDGSFILAVCICSYMSLRRAGFGIPNYFEWGLSNWFIIQKCTRSSSMTTHQSAPKKPTVEEGVTKDRQMAWRFHLKRVSYLMSEFVSYQI